MYQPFAHASNRGNQRMGQPQQMQQSQQQQQQLNYQRVYTSSNQNPSTPSQLNQQIKPSQIVIPQSMPAAQNGGASMPLGQQNINRQQQAYYQGSQQTQQQQQSVSQRPSQYSQQKPQQYRIVNGSSYSQASTQSAQQQQVYQQQQQLQQKQQYQQVPLNYQSLPSAPLSSKSQTVYQNSSAVQNTQGDQVGVQYQKQYQQYTQQPQQILQLQQQQSNKVLKVQQPTPQLNSEPSSLQRLFTKTQAIKIQLQSLSSVYQQNIQNKKLTVDQLNYQKNQFRAEVENLYNQCKAVSREFPQISCVAVQINNGEVGISRTKGSNPIEKEVNQMISLIEENYILFGSKKPIQTTHQQQSLIPVTIQKTTQQLQQQNDLLHKNLNVRDSTYSTHANINMKKSTENLKTIIEESREKTLQDKENSNLYSPIAKAFMRGTYQPQVRHHVEEDQDNFHQYGSTQKERLNTSPDRLMNTDNPGERIQARLMGSPNNVVQSSQNPFSKQQVFQRQYTFNPQQEVQRLNGSNFVQVKDHFTTQPDLPLNDPLFKNNQDDIDKVKRSAKVVIGNPSQIGIVESDNKYRLSTIPQQQYQQQQSYDQFKQVKDLNQVLKDTQQFSIKTTSKDLQKLMDDQKYEQVSEYAYQTLSEIDRQVINMKTTVEQALEQTEMTMTKNLLLEIIESLRQTVKNKEIDISHRVINKIQKNTARLLKDKTASYSLYLYLQKITNFLKERENILNQSIQANEMSLLNQTDHSFWSNNKLDNNDPSQIIPIIEKAKSNTNYIPSSSSASAQGGALNFQFFLRENLNIPSYVPMKEQQRLQEEVRQSVCGNSINGLDPLPRSSVPHSLTYNRQSQSASKPVQFQSKIFESTSVQSNFQTGINVPHYVPYSTTSTQQLDRPQSAQNLNVLGYRSNNTNNILQDLDIEQPSTASKTAVVKQEFVRGNKFLSEEAQEGVKRAQSIPTKIFSGTYQDSSFKNTQPLEKIMPSQNKSITEEFIHQRKLIKAQFSPITSNQSAQITKEQIDNNGTPVNYNIPTSSDKKITQIQRIANGSNQNEYEYSTQQQKIIPGSKNNYTISHLMTPSGKNLNSNTTNLDSILNKYCVVDVEREIKVNNLNNNNNNINLEVSHNQNDQIIHSQVEGFGRNEEDVVKRSAPQNNYGVSGEEILNRENNPNLGLPNSTHPTTLSQKGNRQVNLQYESIIEKYITQNNQNQGQPQQVNRVSLENVTAQNNQSLNKNYSTSNILTQVNQINPKGVQIINNNDPLQSVKAKYDIIVNQQQESLQRTSLNFNVQQMQKKFYDIALRIKSEYPKNHKANTILVNQMWEVAQNIPENQWEDYIAQQCNSAK